MVTDQLSPEAMENARRSPWLENLAVYYKTHHPETTNDKIIMLLAKYDDFEEDLYQAIEVIYGVRPEWPVGVPAKEAKLSPRKKRLPPARVERRLNNGVPVSYGEYLRQGGTEKAWATLPLETTYDRDEDGNLLPLKTRVTLARSKHDPLGSPFCCAKCGRCGALLELLLDPSVMNFQELSSQLSESRMTIQRLEMQLRQQPSVPEVRVPPPVQLPPQPTNLAELQRLQWLLRESHEKEKIQAERANMLSFKIVDLTHELQRQAEGSNSFNEVLAVKDRELKELQQKLQDALVSCSARQTEYEEMRKRVNQREREAPVASPPPPPPPPASAAGSVDSNANRVQHHHVKRIKILPITPVGVTMERVRKEENSKPVTQLPLKPRNSLYITSTRNAAPGSPRDISDLLSRAAPTTVARMKLKGNF
eukprot:TRINITY_DN1970_c0_g2_i1.p1 TRINITY_DN1970_c0_g2~~TRINITY_DN1970_c0_g2_i1.p1  ORF type:complete len:422 (+),score=66.31 TRINITY_DN1970_c0_g2_i1:54-1319(+)